MAGNPLGGALPSHQVLVAPRTGNHGQSDSASYISPNALMRRLVNNDPFRVNLTIIRMFSVPSSNAYRSPKADVSCSPDTHVTNRSATLRYETFGCHIQTGDEDSLSNHVFRDTHNPSHLNIVGSLSNRLSPQISAGCLLDVFTHTLERGKRA
jgi:hypothetical protein